MPHQVDDVLARECLTYNFRIILMMALPPILGQVLQSNISHLHSFLYLRFGFRLPRLPQTDQYLLYLHLKRGHSPFLEGKYWGR